LEEDFEKTSGNSYVFNAKREGFNFDYYKTHGLLQLHDVDVSALQKEEFKLISQGFNALFVQPLKTVMEGTMKTLNTDRGPNVVRTSRIVKKDDVCAEGATPFSSTGYTVAGLNKQMNDVKMFDDDDDERPKIPFYKEKRVGNVGGSTTTSSRQEISQNQVTPGDQFMKKRKIDDVTNHVENVKDYLEDFVNQEEGKDVSRQLTKMSGSSEKPRLLVKKANSVQPSLKKTRVDDIQSSSPSSKNIADKVGSRPPSAVLPSKKNTAAASLDQVGNGTGRVSVVHTSSLSSSSSIPMKTVSGFVPSGNNNVHSLNNHPNVIKSSTSSTSNHNYKSNKNTEEITTKTKRIIENDINNKYC